MVSGSLKDFTPRSRDVFTLIRRHLDAFLYFDGVIAQWPYDSEITVVLRLEATNLRKTLFCFIYI
jgi:hypothetical protein